MGFYLKVGAVATWRRQSEQCKMETQNKSKPSSHSTCQNKLRVAKCECAIDQHPALTAQMSTELKGRELYLGSEKLNSHHTA